MEFAVDEPFIGSAINKGSESGLRDVIDDLGGVGSQIVDDGPD